MFKSMVKSFINICVLILFAALFAALCGGIAFAIMVAFQWAVREFGAAGGFGMTVFLVAFALVIVLAIKFTSDSKFKKG